MTEQRTGAPFVGRDAELRELLAALDEAAEGRGRLILLGGEPGIGKSRLADELAMRARKASGLVLWGRGWEDAGAPPYWPWVQVLRSYVRNTDPSAVRREMGLGASDVAQMLPELRDLFDDLSPPAPSESDAARFQLFDSAATFLRNAAAARRLVVIIDDLQAADTPSIRFLRFLATQLGDMRLLVLGTYRDIELTPDHALTTAISELAREPITSTIVLAGLAPVALRELIGATAGSSPDDRLVTAVARGTKGNPLFVGEALRLFSSEGRLAELASGPPLRVTVPAGVREVIARRIGHLSDGTAATLSIGAALGPEFGTDVLRAITDAGPDDLLDNLDEAVDAGLLAVVAGADGRYRFSHDLVRETLYDELTPGRRVRLHRRVADALERLYGAAPEAHLAELAHHYFEAERDGPPSAKTIDYARRAGDRAARSLAFEEAARLYRLALAAADRAERPDPRLRLEILLDLGDAQSRVADPAAGSRDALLEAADIARAVGAVPELARAALALGGRLPWARPGRETKLIPLIQDALVHLGGADDRLRVRLLTRLACAWRSSPEQRDQSDSLSQQAVELARSLDDPAALSYALTGRFWAVWWPGNPELRLELAREMEVVAESVGDGERLIDAHLMLYMVHSELTDMVAARREAEATRRLATDLRQPAQRWLGVAPRANMALLEGDFAAAEGLIDEETEPGSAITLARDHISSGRMHLFLLRREQGRVAEEEASVRTSIEEFTWYPLHRAALACLLVDVGRADEAQTVLDELGRDAFSALYPDNMWLLGASLAAEAAARLRDVAASTILYEQLAPYRGRHAIGHAEGSVGVVDRYLGLLAATIGRLDDAERHLVDAVRINDRMLARPWAAHSRHDLAGVLRRRAAPGDSERAAEQDGLALAAARQMGMTALASRIDSAAESAADAPDMATEGVFRREGDYWTIRFEGAAFEIRDAKGMRYLARLLLEPGRELHALDLVATQGPVAPAVVAGGVELSAHGAEGSGPRLDAEAKAAYRERLDELRAEVAEAEEWNDGERAAAARREVEYLSGELAAAVGLGGRDRTAASSAERARISVTRAIRGAVARIAAQSPALGRHLEATIHTGTFCSYTPDPRVPSEWTS